MKDEPPILQPPTTRIGGTRSANWIAIGVFMVLAGLVWVGWSGRSGPSGPLPLPSSSVTRAPVAASTPTAIPEATDSNPSASPMAPAVVLPPSTSLADDIYLVTLGFAGADDGAIMSEVAPDQLEAVPHLPSAVPEGGSVELHQLSSVALPNAYVSLGSWELTPDSRELNSPEGRVLVDVRVPAQRDVTNPSLLVRHGFDLEVRALRQLSGDEIKVHIDVLPYRSLLDESYGSRVELGTDQFAIVGVVDTRPYLGLLRESEPGHLRSVVRLPQASLEASSIKLAQLWTREDRKNYVVLGEWPIVFRLVTGDGGVGEPLIEVEVPSQPSGKDRPSLARSGYTLVAHVEREDGIDYLIFEVTATTR